MSTTAQSVGAVILGLFLVFVVLVLVIVLVVSAWDVAMFIKARLDDVFSSWIWWR